MDAPVPRVIATLDPQWLVHSRIAGHQLAYDGERAYDRSVDRQWQWARDVPYAGNHGFLFDRPSVIGFQYVRNGRPGLFSEVYNSYTFSLSHNMTAGLGGCGAASTVGGEVECGHAS